MYHKYRYSLFDILYSYRGKKYRDVPVHWCIVAGLHVHTTPCVLPRVAFTLCENSF